MTQPLMPSSTADTTSVSSHASLLAGSKRTRREAAAQKVIGGGRAAAAAAARQPACIHAHGGETGRVCGPRAGRREQGI
jgi:hypothetical protein